jgi:hypothetical protein
MTDSARGTNPTTRFTIGQLTKLDRAALAAVGQFADRLVAWSETCRFRSPLPVIQTYEGLSPVTRDALEQPYDPVTLVFDQDTQAAVAVTEIVDALLVNHYDDALSHLLNDTVLAPSVRMAIASRLSGIQDNASLRQEATAVRALLASQGE